MDRDRKIDVARAGENENVAPRRRFLATCGRFAAVTPPAVALLLSTSGTSYATAQSGGKGGHGGWGGGKDGKGGKGGKGPRGRRRGRH